MSWNNPPRSWARLERTLSGAAYPPADETPVSMADAGASSDVPRQPRRGAVPYAELHAHSNFSFLDGVSHPEELVAEAAHLGLEAIALTDHDGMYGVVRFADAASEYGMRTVFGAELSIGAAEHRAEHDRGHRAEHDRGHRAEHGRGHRAEHGREHRAEARAGLADPTGQHLLVLARDAEGYGRLSGAISEAQLAGNEKGRPRYELERLAAAADGHWLVLTGCRKGAVRSALESGGKEAAAAELDRLIGLFGADNLVVELTDLGLPTDSARNDALCSLADRFRVSTVATTGAHLARPQQSRLAGSVAAIRARRSLDEMEGWLPAWAGSYLRSGAEMSERFARYPSAVERAAELGRACAFDLNLVAPRLPPFDVPKGRTEAGWLRELVYRGAIGRYGLPQENRAAYQQLDHELNMIEELGFPGYFLVVHDIVAYCQETGILCQGRGSAANSAVCFALGITHADPVRYGLLFERFLSPEREGPPDIDLDIESDRREEAIQYVYRKYGRTHAAQVANVISYRPKSAVRDSARVLGHAPGQQDAWSKEIEHASGLPEDSEIPEAVLELAEELLDSPRHLGIHSGGMVICHQPVSEVCPVEWATMPGRTVLQWDKDDCASAGLVKFDLLGLGMLSALHYAIDMVREHHGVEVDLGALDLADDEVYAMLRRADALGVFQVESRAQLGVLPRLKPREFYDLVVQVALIRPGPIQGGSVHPYIRRRNGQEEWDYEHPLMEPALRKTLGVPLFQEQLMQLAVDVAGFSPAESDELRRAMGAKRSSERMRRLRDRLFEGMAANGITGDLAERIYARLLAFANYGFPESHALSFAMLVFASAWFKRYYPAVFCAALLKAQPMGFYSPQSLVADARRHGVLAHGPDVNVSRVSADPEPDAGSHADRAVRLGLSSVRTLGDSDAERVVVEREAHGPYTGMSDLARRVRLSAAQLEALATAGAFDCFGLSRREALWHAAAAAAEDPARLPGTTVSASTPTLPGMGEVEQAVADVWATGVSPEVFPVRFLRPMLDELGATAAARLSEVEDKARVLVGGAVTHRQRPATAGGITFLNLEDETGMINVVCSPGLWTRYRQVARTSSALLVRGTLERAEGVMNIRAENLRRLNAEVPSTSRDFH